MYVVKHNFLLFLVCPLLPVEMRCRIETNLEHCETWRQERELQRMEGEASGASVKAPHVGLLRPHV